MDIIIIPHVWQALVTGRCIRLSGLPASMTDALADCSNSVAKLIGATLPGQ